MSKWPERRVSLPQDQPTRYLDWGLSRFAVHNQFVHQKLVPRRHTELILRQRSKIRRVREDLSTQLFEGGR